MTRIIILVLLFSCLSAVEISTPPQLSHLDQVIALNQIQEPELDPEALRRAFHLLCDKARVAVEIADTPRQKINALNRVLLQDRQVSYLSNIYWRDATLSAAVLRGQANCLSTSTLYVLVAEELQLPVHMVIIPRHAFVRWEDDSTSINIETTSAGIEISDKDYLRDVESAERTAMRFGDSLDHNGFLAELTEAAAHHLYSAGKLEESLALLNQVEKLAPWRCDLILQHITLSADITKDRQAARQQLTQLLDQDPPASVATSALSWLAEDAGAQQQVHRQRQILLVAFKHAPRNQISGVLQQLAFCHRTLKDWRGAVRYFELAMACEDPNSPSQASHLYNYAILLKNDNRLDDALRAIEQALVINPESWNLQVLKAGYLCLAGKMDEGKKVFASVTAPRVDAEFWANMQAWFCAVSGQKEEFYRLFAAALEASHSERVLNWIEQDVDLDPFRNDVEFQTLVKRHRKRILGETLHQKH